MSTQLTSPWPDDVSGEDGAAPAAGPFRGGTEFEHLLAAQRLVQDRVAGAFLPPDKVVSLTAQLTDITAMLADYQVSEPERWDGWRPDLPGRGHPLLPPYVIDEESETEIRGRVTFTRFYLGGNGAAHGGAQPLLFDDLLGRVANHHQAGVARTAFLKVNYRRITPLDVELRVDVSLDKIEGRKRWASGRLTDPDGTVVADVEALFVELLPGQP